MVNETYQRLKSIAESEYPEIVTKTELIGNRTVGSAKLRVFFKDRSFLDIWLSSSGKYSYHWEQRAQRGTLYRHDNAPDFPSIETYPKHLHAGSENNVQPSYISEKPVDAIKQILDFIRDFLT